LDGRVPARMGREDPARDWSRPHRALGNRPQSRDRQRQVAAPGSPRFIRIKANAETPMKAIAGPTSSRSLPRSASSGWPVISGLAQRTHALLPRLLWLPAVGQDPVHPTWIAAVV